MAPPAAAADALRPAASPSGPDAVAEASGEDKGIRVGLRLSPLDQGRAVLAELSLDDASGGGPVRGGRPLAWLVRTDEMGDAAGEPCHQRIGRHLAGLLATPAAVDFNRFTLVLLTEDHSLAFIQPQLAFSKTKMRGLAALPGAPADWVVPARGERVWLAVPSARRVVAVDVVSTRPKEQVEVGGPPTALEATPDGTRLVAAWDSGFAVLSAADGKVERLGALPAGPVAATALAISEDGATLAVGAGAQLVLIDLADGHTLGALDTGATLGHVAFSATARSVVFTQAGQAAAFIVPTAQLTPEARHTVPLSFAPDLLLVEPGGARLHAAGRAAGRLAVIDAATERVLHTVSELSTPAELGLTPQFVYVRQADSAMLALLDRRTLSAGGRPSITRVTAGQGPPGVGEAQMPLLAPVPTESGVLVAHPADRALYDYQEGMMAPMGSHPTYGRVPRSARMVDRSLRETGPGRFALRLDAPDAGLYELQVLVDPQRAGVCVPLEIGPALGRPHPAAARAGFAPAFDDTLRGIVGQPLRMRFSVAEALPDAARSQPPEGVVFRLPGVAQARPDARWVDARTLELTFVPQAPGRYKVVAGVPAAGLPLHLAQPGTFGVTAAAAP